MKIPIALEIGERYLKIAAAKPIKQFKPLECVVKPIHGLKDEEVSKSIREILEKSGWKVKALTVCLPRNLVTMRNLHLPSHDPDEISQMIDLHIGRIVPYKKEEISFDHLSLRTDSLGYTAEMLAIVHRDILKRYQRILESAALDIDNIFLSSYGVWHRVVEKFKSDINTDELYLILDIDSAYTDFIIFNRENILFSRTIAFEISKDVVANTEVNKFIGEIKQSLLIFHKNESINKKPSGIFVSGATEEDVAIAIKKEFEVPVRIVGSPMEEAGRSKASAVPRDTSVTAVSDFVLEEKGKRLSFALPEMTIRKSLKEKTRELTILGTLLIYLFASVMAFFWGRQYNQQFYLKRLVARNKLIESDIGNLVDQYKRMAFVKAFIYERKTPLILINELEKTTPAEIAINFISIDKSDSVTLRGQGIRLSDVFKFVTTLENSRYFRDVSTKYTRTKKVRDKELTDFEINFVISS